MAKLELKDCREVVVFKALTESKSFLEACQKLTEFDKNHAYGKVVEKPSDKEAMREVYTMCQNALGIAFPRDEKPDFDNVSHLNRLKNVFNQQLSVIYRDNQDDFSSSFKGKIGMGGIFLKQAELMSKMGVKYYKEQVRAFQRENDKVVHEQATTEKYKKLGRSYGGGDVFSKKSTYKPIKTILVGRMIKEKKELA